MRMISNWMKLKKRKKKFRKKDNIIKIKTPFESGNFIQIKKLSHNRFYALDVLRKS